MIDFTGINCVNCRKMEGEVWSDPKVMQTLKNDFVIVSLYVDVQNIDLQESEQYYSKALGKKIATVPIIQPIICISVLSSGVFP